MLTSFMGAAVCVFLARRGVRSIASRRFFDSNFTFRSQNPLTAFSYPLNHSGWRHLGLNMAMVGILGNQLVQIPEVAPKQLAWVMAGSALGTALAESATPLVGASGVVFGMLGALTVLDPQKTWLMIFPLPGVPLTTMQLGQACLVSHLGLLAWRRVTRIAIRGHIGGLLSGGLLAACMWPDKGSVFQEMLLESQASWRQSLTSAGLVLNWLTLTVELSLLSFFLSETQRGELRSKQRFIRRTWESEL